MAILDTRFFAFMARMAARIAFIARIAFAMIEENGKTLAWGQVMTPWRSWTP